jgi:excisionase family DNA binding protein
VHGRYVTAAEEEQPALNKIESIVESVLASEEERVLKLVGSDGEEVELPDSLLHALEQVVHYLEHNQAVMVVPVDKALTSQEAADILNVSRPYLIKLLEEGTIPFVKTGTHRRVQLGDLLLYKQQRDAQRREALATLTSLSQEMGLYDE